MVRYIIFITYTLHKIKFGNFAGNFMDNCTKNIKLCKAASSIINVSTSVHKLPLEKKLMFTSLDSNDINIYWSL